MNFTTAFIELEQKIEHLVSRYTKLKENNDALKREVAFLRQENQRLQSEQDEIEDRIGRIIERVQNQQVSHDSYEHPETAGNGNVVRSANNTTITDESPKNNDESDGLFPNQANQPQND